MDEHEAEQYIAAVRAGELAGTAPCPRCQHPTVVRQLDGDTGPVLYDVTVSGVPAPRGVLGVHTMLAVHDRNRCRELRGAWRIPSGWDALRVATLILLVFATGLGVINLASSLVLPLMGVCR